MKTKTDENPFRGNFPPEFLLANAVTMQKARSEFGWSDDTIAIIQEMYAVQKIALDKVERNAWAIARDPHYVPPVGEDDDTLFEKVILPVDSLRDLVDGVIDNVYEAKTIPKKDLPGMTEAELRKKIRESWYDTQIRQSHEDMFENHGVHMETGWLRSRPGQAYYKYATKRVSKTYRDIGVDPDGYAPKEPYVVIDKKGHVRISFAPPVKVPKTEPKPAPSLPSMAAAAARVTATSDDTSDEDSDDDSDDLSNRQLQTIASRRGLTIVPKTLSESTQQLIETRDAMILSSNMIRQAVAFSAPPEAKDLLMRLFSQFESSDKTATAMIQDMVTRSNASKNPVDDPKKTVMTVAAYYEKRNQLEMYKKAMSSGGRSEEKLFEIMYRHSVFELQNKFWLPGNIDEHVKTTIRKDFLPTKTALANYAKKKYGLMTQIRELQAALLEQNTKKEVEEDVSAYSPETLTRLQTEFETLVNENQQFDTELIDFELSREPLVRKVCARIKDDISSGEFDHATESFVAWAGAVTMVHLNMIGAIHTGNGDSFFDSILAYGGHPIFDLVSLVVGAVSNNLSDSVTGTVAKYAPLGIILGGLATYATIKTKGAPLKVLAQMPIGETLKKAAPFGNILMSCALIGKRMTFVLPIYDLVYNSMTHIITTPGVPRNAFDTFNMSCLLYNILKIAIMKEYMNLGQGSPTAIGIYSSVFLLGHALLSGNTYSRKMVTSLAGLFANIAGPLRAKFMNGMASAMGVNTDMATQDLLMQGGGAASMLMSGTMDSVNTAIGKGSGSNQLVPRASGTEPIIRSEAEDIHGQFPAWTKNLTFRNFKEMARLRSMRNNKDTLGPDDLVIDPNLNYIGVIEYGEIIAGTRAKNTETFKGARRKSKLFSSKAFLVYMLFTIVFGTTLWKANQQTANGTLSAFAQRAEYEVAKESYDSANRITKGFKYVTGYAPVAPTHTDTPTSMTFDEFTTTVREVTSENAEIVRDAASTAASAGAAAVTGLVDAGFRKGWVIYDQFGNSTVVGGWTMAKITGSVPTKNETQS